MPKTPDAADAVIRPPLAWGIAILAGVAAGCLHPLPLTPAGSPHALLGGAVFALVVSAMTTIRKAGSRVESTEPTTTIVASAPFRYTRNPIYTGMFLGQIGLALGFDNLWMLAMLVPYYLVIRHRVLAREEAYLAGKFGPDYRQFQARVRRWL